MSDASQPRLEPGHEAEGKPAALIAWALYILSIPSANVLVLVGLVVAYAARGAATEGQADADFLGRQRGRLGRDHRGDDGCRRRH